MSPMSQDIEGHSGNMIEIDEKNGIQELREPDDLVSSDSETYRDE